MKEKLINEDYKLPDITTSLNDATMLFRNLSEDKLSSVRELITDIESMMVGRKELNKELLASLDKITIDVDNAINQIQNSITISTSNSGEAIKALGDLRKKKIEIDELKLQEKLNFWRDIAMLKKELREHVKELREKESKSTLIDTLLEE
ncbi:MAG: hypothetical protein QW404_03690 [Candidatus Nanoarchaeia archaeon]